MKGRTLVFGGLATAAAGLASWYVFRDSASDAGSATSAAVTTDAIGDQIQTLPRGQVPVFAGKGEIARLYRHAVEHGDELRYIPCFCGCYRFGHASNRDCYVRSFNRDGTLTFTSHAAT